LKATLLINPIGELATCFPTNAPVRGLAMRQVSRIKDAAVAVADGMIIACGRSSDVLGRVKVESDTKVLDATNKLVTPGLIDPHTHLVFAGNRADEFVRRCQGESYKEIAESGGGILASVRATRQAHFRELVELALLRLSRLLAHGTTTCEIKTGYGLDLASEIKLLQVILHLSDSQPVGIVPTFMAAHAVPPGKSKAEYVREVVDLILPEAAKVWSKHVRKSELNPTDKGLSKSILEPRCFIDVFCDQGYFSVEEARDILEAGVKLGFSPRIHANEFADLGGIKLAVDLKAVSVDHLLTVSPEEISLLAESNIACVILPGTSFCLDLKKHAPAKKLIAQGGWICLGSDFNPGTCPIFALPTILALACLNLKLTPEEALVALTVNPAFLLGLGDRIGQIREGYQADITIYDVACLEEVPYSIGRNPVLHTIKKGRIWSGELISSLASTLIENN